MTRRQAEAVERFGPWLLAIAIALFGYRFLNRDLFPFVSDEPRFLHAARAQLYRGAWLSFSPLLGSQGLHYGPTVLWLYGVVHVIAGAAPETHILVMTALVTIANVAAAISIGRLFGDRYFVPSALLVLVAASPYHFFWSRLAWDQCVEICSGIVVALLCRKRDIGFLGSAAVGLALGLGLSSHLMIVPFVCAAFACLLVRAPRGRRVASTALALAVAAVVNIPYGLYLRTTVHQADAGGSFSARSLIDKLGQPFRVASAAGTDFFFDSSWTRFRAFSPTAALAADVARYLLPLAMLAAALVLLWTVWRNRARAQRISAGFALVVWIGCALFYAWRRLPSHPHYQFPCWWIVPVALAAGLGMMPRRCALFYVAVASVWLWSLLPAAFTVDWMRFVRMGAGMPEDRYGTVVSEQRAALRRACEMPEVSVCLKNETVVYPVSLLYLATVEPTCSGKSILVAEACAPTRGQRALTLSYAQPGQARLGVR